MWTPRGRATRWSGELLYQKAVQAHQVRRRRYSITAAVAAPRHRRPFSGPRGHGQVVEPHSLIRWSPTRHVRRDQELVELHRVVQAGPKPHIRVLYDELAIEPHADDPVRLPNPAEDRIQLEVRGNVVPLALVVRGRAGKRPGSNARVDVLAVPMGTSQVIAIQELIAVTRG